MSGSPNTSPIAGQNNLNLANHPKCQIIRNVAKFMTDNEVTMNDVQTGLLEIHVEEEKTRILLFKAISSLPASKIQGMLMVILEKNLVFREWSEKHWDSKMIESGTGKKLDRTRFLNWIKEFDHSDLQQMIRNLIWQNEIIEELLKKKLLVEKKDGTFAVRKFELENISGYPSGWDLCV